jgi:serine/threonine-protein kinase ATR
LYIEFDDGIEVMKSLAKPRKITIRADNGKMFAFLGKPRDDLRKDARLMDFNAIINKLLKTNSDSRRRQLREFRLVQAIECYSPWRKSRYTNVQRYHTE